jgi:periplasmic copper chaperone A
MLINRIAFVACLTLSAAMMLGGPAFSHEFEVGEIKIVHPWMHVPLKGEKTAQLYMVIENNGEKPDRLVGGKSDVSNKVEIHGAKDDKIDGVEVTPFSASVLKPGTEHVMLVDLKEPVDIEAGDMLDVTLNFEKSGSVTVSAAVEAPSAKHAHDRDAMDAWDKEQQLAKAKQAK